MYSPRRRYDQTVRGRGAPAGDADRLIPDAIWRMLADGALRATVEATGHDPRTLADLLELIVVTRLAGPAAVRPTGLRDRC